MGILAVSVGCENAAKFANAAPTNLAFQTSKCFIQTGGTLSLSGAATDDDGDSLTFTWKATKGAFTPSPATGKSVSWTAPAEQGPVTITMTVTDDVAKVSKAASIAVCLPFPSSIAGYVEVGSPGDTFIMLGDNLLRISSAATLTIAPGVTIVVDNESGGFEVYGRLVARGEPGNRIKIQGNACAAGSGLWSGIYLEQSLGVATLANVDLTMSKDGIQVDNAILAADSCEIYDNENAGISVLLEGSRASIHHCTIWDNGTGIYLQNSTADIRSSSIRYSAGNGVELSYTGDSTPVTIDSCTVANSGVSGIQLAGTAAPEIHYCSIFSNGENTGEHNYGVKLASYTAVDSVHAENNYWGLGNTTAAKISTVIFDKNDNPVEAQAYVGFTPWLSTGPVMTSPAGGAGAKGSAWARSSR